MSRLYDLCCANYPDLNFMTQQNLRGKVSHFRKTGISQQFRESEKKEKQTVEQEQKTTSRVGSGNDSTRNTNGRTQKKRTPVVQEATAFYDINKDTDQVISQVGNQSTIQKM